MRYWPIWVVFSIVLASVTGCEKKNTGGTSVNAEDITAVRDILARGMRETAVSELTPADRGKKCVVTAAAPAGGYRPTPPPPPPGMVRPMGQAIIYSGEFDGVSADSLTVLAAYPTPGNYKRIDISKDDVQSFHLAP
jgi:hypothetical protein